MSAGGTDNVRYDLPSAHGLTLRTDMDGWNYAVCDCAWIGPPCPDVETAAEFYADHVLAEVGR